MTGTVVSIPREDRPPVEVTWGAMFGEDHYLADLVVQPLAMSGPPAWLTFEFGQPPADETPSEADFATGIGKVVAQLGLRIDAALLRRCTPDQYFAAAEAAQ